MPMANRSEGRNVHIYNASDPNEVLGGLILENGVTKANFHSMIEILFIFPSTYFLRHNDDTNTVVQRDNTPLRPGNYYIVATGSISVNDEPLLVRTTSLSSGTRIRSFREAVRSRDRRCIITGEEVIRAKRGNWTGFEAAHIFPLAYNTEWIKGDFSRCITKPAANGESINSVQNGLLLRADMHQLFGSYMVSINPDDDYKIIFFDEDGANVAGRHLDQRFVNDPDRPVNQLLRWHFRQAVLANMRGVGEQIFEHDFPPGSDMLGEIRDGPMEMTGKYTGRNLFVSAEMVRDHQYPGGPSSKLGWSSNWVTAEIPGPMAISKGVFFDVFLSRNLRPVVVAAVEVLHNVSYWMEEKARRVMTGSYRDQA